MAAMKTPGVYIVEKNAFPSTVVEVATAVPAFIGYTERAKDKAVSLINKPVRISSMGEYHTLFGGAPLPKFTVSIITDKQKAEPNDKKEFDLTTPNGDKFNIEVANEHTLYYNLKLFFANGGGPCYIVSVGDYDAGIEADDMKAALDPLKKEMEPTMIVIPEAVSLDAAGCTNVQQAMLNHCGVEMRNRFAILDVPMNKYSTETTNYISAFRTAIGTTALNYGASYYPWLETSILSDGDISLDNIVWADQKKISKSLSRIANKGEEISKYFDEKVIEIANNPEIAEIIVIERVKAKAAEKSANEELETAEKELEAAKGEDETAAATKVVSEKKALAAKAKKAAEIEELIANANKAEGERETAENALKAAVESKETDDKIADLTQKLDNETKNAKETSDIKEEAEAEELEIASKIKEKSQKKVDQSKVDLHFALTNNWTSYQFIIKAIKDNINLLPPSAAMAGLYTMVDNTRGVWKAPANISVNSVIKPSVDITNEEQEDLNMPVNGKAINAIRTFIGDGVKVWGARTMDGNSMDWRYINVRRTMIFLEESVKNASRAYVFEPNVSGTWLNMRCMIENFLKGVWKRGGLAGATPEDAYSVQVGLGETMSPEDILDGILRITVLVAISRPAEFIEITFQQQMQKS